MKKLFPPSDPALKSQFLSVALAVLAVSVLAVPAQAAVIIDDNFNGTAGSTLNPAYWVANTGNKLNGDGTASIGNYSLGVGGELDALSSLNVAPGASHFVRATFYIQNTDHSAWNEGFSLSPSGTYSQSGGITILDYADSLWRVNIDGQGGTYGDSTGFGKGQYNYTLQIDWYQNKVVVSFPAIQVPPVFDSSVTEPGWTIPANGRTPSLMSWWGTTVDRVTYETVIIPEPGALALLGLGGLAALIRRKRA